MVMNTKDFGRSLSLTATGNTTIGMVQYTGVCLFLGNFMGKVCSNMQIKMCMKVILYKGSAKGKGSSTSPTKLLTKGNGSMTKCMGLEL